MAFREEFIAALELLGRAFYAVMARGHPAPILVGGAAVEYYTGGAVTSGDFDVVASAEEALARALIEQGFRKEDRPGYLFRGYYHPALAIGVEIVGSRLFDGNADTTRTVLVEVSDSSKVAMVAIEDLIADRMGQFCSSPQGVSEMLNQAVRLFQFAESLDEDYLNERIRVETSETYDLAFLKAKAAER